MRINKEKVKRILKRMYDTLIYVIHDNRGTLTIDDDTLKRLARFYLPYIQDFYANKRREEQSLEQDIENQKSA